eukprot:m.47576 g.47576  ORF g.47576 m.47576 type:complete len:68 (+) comp33801_c0_seq16:3097-3300(+)
MWQGWVTCFLAVSQLGLTIYGGFLLGDLRICNECVVMKGPALKREFTRISGMFSLCLYCRNFIVKFK